jgi:AmmeMemoRadiSam system protein B
MPKSKKILLAFIILIFGATTLFIPQYLQGDWLRGKGDEKLSYENKAIAENSIRIPAVAGSFYPADRGELERMIDGFLKQAKKDLDEKFSKESILMVFAPHAGYVFSGRTASYAFAPIMGRKYDTVVLIGSPHGVPVNGASVYCGNGFSTPLGIIPVNNELANTIVETIDLIYADDQPHIPEHSLEVELPFLKKVLGDFTIVPILVSGNRQQLDLVAQAITDSIRRSRGSTEGILFVISTDLSHYPKQEDAIRSDSEILDALCTLDTDTLVYKDNEIMGRGIQNLACTMCGLEAVYVGIQIANIIGAEKALLLHTSTSADAEVPGASADSVVGYGAVVITGHPKILPSVFEPLTQKEQAYLLEVARLTLKEYLENEQIPEIHIPDDYRTHLSEMRGVFVSLYKDNQLRGCFGTHGSSIPLYKTVQLMTLNSGLSDPRFPPLTLEEIDEIQIEISVYLSCVDPISSVEEIDVGKHGIIGLGQDNNPSAAL